MQETLRSLLNQIIRQWLRHVDLIPLLEPDAQSDSHRKVSKLTLNLFSRLLLMRSLITEVMQGSEYFSLQPQGPLMEHELQLGSVLASTSGIRM